MTDIPTDKDFAASRALMDHLEDGGYATVWVCQGPPRCNLEGDDAVAAMEAGCPFCKQIRVDEDGNETTIEPGNA